MDGWMNEKMVRWMDRWTDGKIDGWITDGLMVGGWMDDEKIEV